MQEIGNLWPFEKPLATLLTMIEVDPDDPAIQNPTKPIGPIYGSEEADRLAGEKGWTFKSDGRSMRRVVPSPRPKRIFGIDPVKWWLERGTVVICAGGGGIPVIHTDETSPAGRKLTGVEAVIDKDIASAALAGDTAACEFVSQTGGIAAIGSIDDAQGLLHGTAGTRVAPDPDPPVGSLGAPRTTETAR